MNDLKEIKFTNLLIIVLVIVFVLYQLIRYINENKLIEKSKYKYSVGEIYYFEKGGRVSDTWGYFYFVNGKKIKSNQSILGKYHKLSTDSLRRFKGHRYIVGFYDKLPKRSELLLAYEITNDTLQAPPEGWDKIPPDSILCPTGKK